MNANLNALSRALEERRIDDAIFMAKEIPRSSAGRAAKLLEKFYEHEVSVANAVIDMIAYTKVYRSKVKPPLKGCFRFTVSETNN
ncbi:hypothetical protein HK407_12g18560 [Ordospora pajunii]|uniref:uncharacterized protein n=1 Tax=Ordospora pajunii TaxID=3039483 RepID=UPI0029525EEA|nr:uncharacterized protein HK407_12g18560 [Ordospora pajunii]KAH9410724.1 hypothetical protein HK407_12g18560 [Ordospora pajunii]